MALNFPSSPSIGDTYGRWAWNGVSWITAPAAAINYLPLTGGTLTGPGNLTVDGITTLRDDAAVDGDVSVTGGVTADHVTTTGTSLDVAGAATIGGTLTVNGATEFNATVEIGGEPVATEDWTMQQVAAGGLWQGTWDAENNVPDLTQTAVQLDGYTWAVVLSDPTASFTIPATPVIPGLNGEVVWTGYHVIWSTSANEFQIVPGGGMSLTQAQDMFLAKTGGVLAGPGGANGALTANSVLAVDQFQVGNAPWFQVTGTIFNVDTGGSAFFSNKASYYFNGPLNAKEIAFGVCNTADGGPEISIGPMGHLIIQSGTNFDIIGTPMLNGKEIATQEYVQNNQVTLAGGLPITGGTLTGPGNLTVNGTFNQNGYSFSAKNIYSQGNYPNTSIYMGRFSDSMYGPPSNPYYGRFTAISDGFSIFDPQPWPPPVVGPGTWGNIIRIGGSEPSVITFTPYYEFGGADSISLQHTGPTGLTFFTNIPNTWGTFFGSYGSAGANPKIFALGASPGGSYQFIETYNWARKPGGGTWDTLSDGRTKTDVHDYTAGLAELTKLNPISFRYNGRARMPETGQSYVGLHAEEAQKVMPEMVYSAKGKLDYDDDGDTDILYMNATALAYATINALKEITKRLEALEEKLK